jgi:hypothetical protein
MEAPRTGDYILERTWDFFVGRPDEPCSGAARLEPTNSGVAPLRSSVSTVKMRPPRPLGGRSSGLCNGRSWTLASET